MCLLLLLIASVSSYPFHAPSIYPQDIEPFEDTVDYPDYLDQIDPELEAAEVLPYIGLQDYDDIDPYMQEAFEDYIEKQQLPWYSDISEEDMAPEGWEESVETPLENRETLLDLDLDSLGENYIQSALDLQREKNKKRSEEILENYNIGKNPYISTRKTSNSMGKAAQKKAITPKKFEQTSSKKASAESQLLPEKRGMPEVPIFRPASPSDKANQVTPQAVNGRPRIKRAAHKPTPFFGANNLNVASHSAEVKA